jgi:hypothetical protein
MLPAIRGILPRTRSVFTKHSGDEYLFASQRSRPAKCRTLRAKCSRSPKQDKCAAFHLYDPHDYARFALHDPI